MSGSLLQIKKKIGGVKSTRKITKAMQLVAASKMRQFQVRATHARAYTWDLFSLLQKNVNSTEGSVYTESRDSGKVCFVLYTSDKGLCGPLNTKLINRLFRSDRWNNLKEDERMLITIGRKSTDFAKSRKIPVAESFINVPEKLSAMDTLTIVEKLLSHWREGDIKEMVFIAPHYKNSFTAYPVMKTFLPFTEDTVESSIGALESDDQPEIFAAGDGHVMLFDPEEEKVMERLHEQLIHSLFVQSYMELKAAEYSSRMIAMQNATDSADRMIKDLSMVYNKARQQAITQEIAELVGAGMALEDTD